VLSTEGEDWADIGRFCVHEKDVHTHNATALFGRCAWGFEGSV
jgi:hypothetical protein